MSPRSVEFLEAAHRRLRAAEAVSEEDPSTALSAAYYAMLYAARAALSERGVSAKTHRGTWHEFRRAFVETGEVDSGLVASVQKVQPEREQADYDAWPAPAESAHQAIDLAGRFLAAIDDLAG
ncbi:MAG TPA: HEPN domain-containing protein [Solirubrobacteraceae bacterium]|nr:HEPN domain-containing protein [Solirubrobacteraceae bacterium]